MTPELILKKKSTPGSMARRLRVHLRLSKQKLADIAGVPLEQVGLFECDLPVPLDSRRRMFKELLDIKSRK